MSMGIFLRQNESHNELLIDLTVSLTNCLRPPGCRRAQRWSVWRIFAENETSRACSRGC